MLPWWVSGLAGCCQNFRCKYLEQKIDIHQTCVGSWKASTPIVRPFFGWFANILCLFCIVRKRSLYSPNSLWSLRFGISWWHPGSFTSFTHLRRGRTMAAADVARPTLHLYILHMMDISILLCCLWFKHVVKPEISAWIMNHGWPWVSGQCCRDSTIFEPPCNMLNRCQSILAILWSARLMCPFCNCFFGEGAVCYSICGLL